MLKSVLALLLSKLVKRSDTEFIASQPIAGNKANAIELYSNQLGNMDVSGTAPCNGWLRVACGDSIKSYSAQNTTSLLTFRGRNKPDTNLMNWPCVTIPCAKGDTWNVVINTTSGATGGAAISFIPSIGG